MNIILSLFLANEGPEFIMQESIHHFPADSPHDGEPRVTITSPVLGERGQWANDIGRKPQCTKTHFKKHINSLDKSIIQDYTQDFSNM